MAFGVCPAVTSISCQHYAAARDTDHWSPFKLYNLLL